MMNLRSYNKDKHLQVLEGWVKKRDLNYTLLMDLPVNGYVAIDNDVPIACAFLRVCEGGMAILEGLMTDPDAEAAHRNTAIDELVSRLIEDAEAAGITKVLAYSIDQGVLERSKKHGFEKTPFTLIALELWG